MGGGGVKSTKVKCIYRPQSVRNEICLRDFNTLANVLPVCECQLCVCVSVCVLVGQAATGRRTQKVNEFVCQLKN